MGTIETRIRWNLKDLLQEPIEEDVESQLGKLEQDVSNLEAMRAEMTEAISEKNFTKALNLIECVHAVMRRLQGYSYLWLSEDTQDKAALNLRDRLDQSLVSLGNRVLFFEIWFKDLPNKIAKKLIAQSGDAKYYLESIRRFKPYTLSERDEKILAIKDPNGIDALVSLYEMITNRFIFSLEVDGEKKSLSRDQMTGYYYNSSAELRAAAYQELYRVYGENSTVLAQIYSHRVRDWHAEGVELRGYPSPIAARNLGNDLPDEVVNALLSVCRTNVSLFQRYFKFKAHCLGMQKLRRYDIYAPLAKAEKKYDFQYASTLIMDTFQEFSPQMASLAKQIVDGQHLDAEIRHGKRGGAFCYAPLPELTPWVLVNYSGRAGDIATMAHEMGHAVHSMLAKNHSILSFHPSQPLAETASIFAEMLLTDRLLREEKDPAVRRDLLVRMIDDAYATVMRQAFFTLFEQDSHRMLVEGKSFDELAEHYYTNISEQFGTAIELSDEFKWEWITVPHFYNAPFYTYSYSFGQLLVLALYQQYRREGTAFIPRYLKILAYGGSEAPIRILQEAGLDITSATFWQGGFDVLETMISELTQIELNKEAVHD
jgi:oligoendopeptidase F